MDGRRSSSSSQGWCLTVVWKNVGMRLCQYVALCFHALSLPCLHTFGHTIPTSFKCFLFSCNIKDPHYRIAGNFLERKLHELVKIWSSQRKLSRFASFCHANGCHTPKFWGKKLSQIAAKPQNSGNFLSSKVPCYMVWYLWHVCIRQPPIYFKRFLAGTECSSRIGFKYDLYIQSCQHTLLKRLSKGLLVFIMLLLRRWVLSSHWDGDLITWLQCTWGCSKSCKTFYKYF